MKAKREEKKQEMFEHTEQYRDIEEAEAMAEFERTFGEDEEAAALKIQQRARGMRDRCVGVCGCVWACVAVNDSVRG